MDQDIFDIDKKNTIDYGPIDLIRPPSKTSFKTPFKAPFLA